MGAKYVLNERQNFVGARARTPHLIPKVNFALIFEYLLTLLEILVLLLCM